LVGTDTDVGGCALVPSPLSVTATPPVTVVEPLTPAWEALQELEMLAALKVSLPSVPGAVMEVELVTDPAGPVVPCELTVRALAEKNVAGPTTAKVPSESVWETFPPAGGSTTDGLEVVPGFEFAVVGTHPGGVFGAVQATWPFPRVLTGPPKRLTFS